MEWNGMKKKKIAKTRKSQAKPGQQTYCKKESPIKESVWPQGPKNQTQAEDTALFL